MAGRSESARTIIEIDPFAEETLCNPGTFDRAALAAESVLYLPQYDLWALARHDLVKSAFADWRRFSSASGTGLTNIGKAAVWRRPSLILENDPPDHGRYRKIMASVLTGETLTRIRAQFAETADALAAALVAQGEFDAAKDYAQIFPFIVVPTMLGLPEEHREAMLTYSELNFNAMGPDNLLLKQSREKAAPIMEVVVEHCRRERLSDDGLGARIYAACAQAGIDEDDAAVLVRTFFSASMDTTMNGIGFAIQSLAQHPEQWALVRRDLSLVKAAFDESLRHRSPSPYIGRTTTCDVEIEGVTIPAESKVLLLVGAANRDPRRFDDPDRFDLRRNSAGHVAFGVGIHACIGQMVAKLEAEMALEALARHAATIVPAGEPRYQMNNWLRGLSSLPIRATAA
ncbi:cytochrome P450 [Sphingomonas sp. So64.6b]|uniref:cytochrome P450 n=1 Tax=Sphingomonas sp. So64.6b TaxID=2997354 RepID=UPI001601AC33|nr:cytochrome P450 [Sphingomonas sp. So64.6b]QNA82654.1 cytochrome P450 [Sphingomonas sp. So64.6b]